MKYLIDRSAVWRELIQTHPIGFNNDDIAEAFKNAPTIDAVEVVRCRECVWRCQHPLLRNAHQCGRITNNGITVKSDFFCKYGERKEDSNGKGN